MAANDPVLPSRELMRQVAEAVRLVLSTPTGQQAGRRAIGAPGPRLLLGKLEADLDADGTATATIWGYYPDDEEHKASEQTEYPVHGWLLAEGTTLAEGTRVAIAIIGAAAYVIRPRPEPGDCVATLEGIPVDQYPGYVAGSINVPYITEDGCWAFSQPNTDCPD